MAGRRKPSLVRGTNTATQLQIAEELGASNHVLIVSGDGSVTFAARYQSAAARHPVVIGTYMEEAFGLRHMGAYVRADAVRNFFDVAGIDLAALQAMQVPRVQKLIPSRTMVEVGTEVAGATAAGNVADKAVIAALLELGKAFAEPGARPVHRRSIRLN